MKKGFRKSSQRAVISSMKSRKLKIRVSPAATLCLVTVRFCVHQYSCTCMNFLLQTTICKHIHLVLASNPLHTAPLTPSLATEVALNTVVNCLLNTTNKEKDLQQVRDQCQSELNELSLCVQSCDEVESIHTVLHKLRQSKGVCYLQCLLLQRFPAKKT
jgi:hypothetical protein